jgi:hypothetical protein
MNNQEVHLCYYGCGQKATYLTVKRNHWICNKNPKQCPSLRKRISESVKKTGFKPNNEQRAKISLSMKNRIVSDETRRKLSEANLGPKNKQYGKQLSEETKRKISEATSGSKNWAYGRHLSEETKQKLSFINTGKKVKEDVKAKISKSMRGKKKSEEHCRNISEGWVGRVLNDFAPVCYKGIKIYEFKNINDEFFKLRGSYELKMANFLNEKKILWTNKARLLYKDGEKFRNYFPDFYLPELNKYIEVKGWFNEESKLKIKLVLNQNDITLLMAFRSDIENLEEFYKKLIPV